MPKFLTSNLLIKVFSLLLAVLLWVYITGQVKSEMSFSVPLELTNIPSNLEITNELPPFISVRLRGNSSTLRNVRPGNIKVVLDLSRIREGRSFFRIDKGHIALPKGLKAVKISPEKLTIKAELLLEKEVPVMLNRKGFKSNWKVKFEPTHVKVHGVKSKVLGIRMIKTKPLDLSNIELKPGKSIEKEVELKSPGKGLYLAPERVKVVVTTP